MKKIIAASLLLLTCLPKTTASVYETRNEPDSVYLFAYATTKNDYRNGLHFAWSRDLEELHPIGPEYSFLRCDYGRWGQEKRMINPILKLDKNGLWHCLWTLNERDGAFAHTTSEDLIHWKPQSYPLVMPGESCNWLNMYHNTEGVYTIYWTDGKDPEEWHFTRTRDFKNYTPVQSDDDSYERSGACISGEWEAGVWFIVPWQLVDNLIRTCEYNKYKQSLYAETTATDHIRFAGLERIEAGITPQPEQSKEISDMLIGIFFEDINYAADGGLYAELVQNRGFEYTPDDRREWNARTAWTLAGEGGTFDIDTLNPIHPNNSHYAVLQAGTGEAALANEGFGGIALKAGDKYDLSLFARSPEAKRGKLKIRLAGPGGEIYGEATTPTLSPAWRKYELVITSNATTAAARLEIIPQQAGTAHLDMVSLFPQKTFKGRKNGLREDLAQVLADMKPRFVRFPGGCVAHGDGLENMYRWKNTIGPPETRKPQRNLWGYHQTAGLGYYEYFLFCEDIGAEPLPVLPAGVPCQNSAHHGHPLGGQQGGIPMEEMDEYIQEVLDLIEWANGDAKTTAWGKIRAGAGHAKPFNLKYIGIGNEDLISDVFEERYRMICRAINEKYPDITVIGTTGPFYEGSDYTEGWRIATEAGIPMVDEHYYNPPGWYIHNQDFYDRYDRDKAKVYLGEYAAHLPGRPNNIETALAEALHLINIERNGDVVALTSYAPLLAKEGFTQWNPDLIYFNNTEVKPTVGYHVQKLFGTNPGDRYIPGKLNLDSRDVAAARRIAVSVTEDSRSGDYIVKMVNLLPVPVRMNMPLSPFGISRAEIEISRLSGKPDDRTAKPVSSGAAATDAYGEELPPYSFTVWRIKKLN